MELLTMECPLSIEDLDKIIKRLHGGIYYIDVFMQNHFFQITIVPSFYE